MTDAQGLARSLSLDGLGIVVRDYGKDSSGSYWRQWMRFDCSNGYGLSVMRGSSSYGGGDGLWEACPAYAEGGTVIPQHSAHWLRAHFPGWGDDVHGWLTAAQVEQHLREMAGLPQRGFPVPARGDVREGPPQEGCSCSYCGPADEPAYGELPDR